MLHGSPLAESYLVNLNADRLRPFPGRADAPPAPGPLSDPGQEGVVRGGAEAELAPRNRGGVDSAPGPVRLTRRGG